MRPTPRWSIPLLLLGACSSGEEPKDTGRVSVAVAPLSLEGVSDACYDLRVLQGALPGGAPVWSQTGLCADRYGDGSGSLTYVGTCDATAPEGQVAKNTVELVMRSLWTSGSSPDGTELSTTEYRNPCPADQPCRIEADCRENADTLAEFNLTIARSANQGFFDVAVNFEDIFCSAKVDCNDDAGDTMTLLHNPDNGNQRDATLVAAFACYAGSAQTFLHMGDVEIVCPNTTYTLPPSAGVGGTIPLGAADAVLFGASIFEGLESGAGAGVSYWNVALGIDEATLPAAGCSFRLKVTASDESWPFGYMPARHTTYPVIEADVPLEIRTGELFCGQHPVDGLNSAVRTQYRSTGPLVGTPFCHELQPAGSELTVELPDCGVTNVFPNGQGGDPIFEYQGQLYSVSAPEGAFADDQGEVVSGNIAMVITTTGFTGGFAIGDDAISAEAIADFDFFDSNGDPVQVAAGKKVTVWLPLPTNELVTVGEEIDVYYYDEATSAWVFETVGRVVVRNGLFYLEAEVGHFTWYGPKIANNKKSCLNVEVRDQHGAPLEGALVRGTTSPVPGNWFEAYTGSDGRVCLETKVGTKALVNVINALGPVSPVQQVTGTAFATALVCGAPSCANLPVPFVVQMPADDCDGDFQAGEECDGGDDCLTDCTCPGDMLADGVGGCTACGNGIVNAGEECDPGVSGNDNCSYGVCACIANTFLHEQFCYDECPVGWSEDIVSGTCVSDGCEDSPCANGVCTDNGSGGFTCDCTGTGYGGTTCAADVDECSTGADNCHADATCTNSTGAFSCACNAGFDGDGVTCADIDECTTGADDCVANANCTNTTGGFQCTCASGFQGIGNISCTDINDCAPNPCVHGSCTDQGANAFSCACVSGFSDATCSTNTNDCTPLSCANGGVCVDGMNGFTCDCSLTGFGGPTCSECPSGEVPDLVNGGCTLCGNGVVDATEECDTAADSRCEACIGCDVWSVPDVSGLCVGTLDGVCDSVGDPDCDGVCQLGEHLINGQELGRDCDYRCNPGDTEPSECDGFCFYLEEDGSADCNGVCDGPEGGGPDCEGACGRDDTGPDCDFVCDAGDHPDGLDCNGLCEGAAQMAASGFPSRDETGPDCNGFCDIGDGNSTGFLASHKKDGDGGPDCNTFCESTDHPESFDCDEVCHPGDLADSHDCNGVCAFTEGGSADCDFSTTCGNNVWDPGEECDFWSSGDTGFYPCVNDSDAYDGLPLCTCSEGFSVGGFCQPFGVIDVKVTDAAGSGAKTLIITAQGNQIYNTAENFSAGAWNWVGAFDAVRNGVDYRLSFNPPLPAGTACDFDGGDPYFADIVQIGSEWSIDYRAEDATALWYLGNMSQIKIRCDVQQN